jgi:hypothetical protein
MKEPVMGFDAMQIINLVGQMGGNHQQAAQQMHGMGEVDPQQHAGLLGRFGLDPQQLQNGGYQQHFDAQQQPGFGGYQQGQDFGQQRPDFGRGGQGGYEQQGGQGGYDQGGRGGYDQQGSQGGYDQQGGQNY